LKTEEGRLKSEVGSRKSEDGSPKLSIYYKGNDKKPSFPEERRA